MTVVVLFNRFNTYVVKAHLTLALTGECNGSCGHLVHGGQNIPQWLTVEHRSQTDRASVGSLYHRAAVHPLLKKEHYPDTIHLKLI